MNTQQSKNRPTHVAKVRHGTGESVTYREIGVGWANTEDGSCYVRLHGQQIVTEPFTLYQIERD